MNGLVLSETPVESIVPPRGLVELGYAITWSRAGCVVKHPRLKKPNAGCDLDVQWSEKMTLWLSSPRSSAWTRKRGPTDVSRWKNRIPVVPRKAVAEVSKNRKPIGEVGCWWLELCFLEGLQWLQWSPYHNCWM